MPKLVLLTTVIVIVASIVLFGRFVVRWILPI